MLQWICPECGRECEPDERDCPVCYPSAVAPKQKVKAVALAAAPRAVVPITAPDPVPAAATTAKFPIPSHAATGPMPPWMPSPMPLPASMPSAFAPPSSLASAVANTVPSAVAVAELPVLPPPPEPEIVPVPAAMPDPVPAGLTALSTNMRTFDDQARRRNVWPVPAQPIPADLRAPQSNFYRAQQPIPLSNGRFNLPKGRLSGLNLPSYCPVVGSNALQSDLDWIPLAQPIPAVHLVCAQVLDFDPALLQLLAVQNESESELCAMEALGLAPRRDANWCPPNVSAPPVTPLAGASTGYLAWRPALGMAPVLETAPLVDVSLRQSIAQHQAEQRAIDDLEALVQHLGPRLLTAYAPNWIQPTPPQSEARTQNALRGYATWPKASPAWPAVAAVEIDFDADLLRALQEPQEEAVAFVEEPIAPPPVVPVELPPLPNHLALVPVSPSTTSNDTQDTAEVPLVALNPIVEVTVPPTAKLQRLPFPALQPRGAEPKPKHGVPQAEFSDFSPLILSVGKAIRIIPSPILNIQHSRVMAPPSWLVTAAVALLIPITALGVVNYWILPAQRAAAPSATTAPKIPEPVVATVKPSAPPPSPVVAGAPDWQKQMELAGLRIKDSTVKCLLVNHGRTDSPVLNIVVTLRSANARAGESAVGSFRVRLSPLGAGESREFRETISFTQPNRSVVDWADLRADLQVSKP